MRQVQENHTATQRPSSISCYDKTFASSTPDPLGVGPFTTDLFSSPCGMFISPSISFISGNSCTSFSLSESSAWFTTVSSI